MDEQSGIDYMIVSMMAMPHRRALAQFFEA
jgi:hypothetical protein